MTLAKPVMTDDEKFFLDWPAWAARLLMLSAKLVRVKVLGYPDPPQGEPVIYAHWHCEDLSMLPHFTFIKANILISPSRDGAMLSRAVKVMGYHTCRGSSSREGAAGLRALKTSLAAGQNVIFAADGPKGPRAVAKAGAVYLAAKTGRPIYPVGSAASLAHVFKGTWSQTRLPLPGSKLAVVFGPPLFFPPEAIKWPIPEQSQALTRAIDEAVRAAREALEDWGHKSNKDGQGA